MQSYKKRSRINWCSELKIPDIYFRIENLKERRDDQWKLKHHVLSLPVPNEKFKEVMNAKETVKKDKEELKWLVKGKLFNMNFWIFH